MWSSALNHRADHNHSTPQCQYVDYQNPRMVVGTIVQHEGRILLCRRGIEPQRGLWTVPAGAGSLRQLVATRAKVQRLPVLSVQGAVQHEELGGPGYLLMQLARWLAGWGTGALLLLFDCCAAAAARRP